MSFFQTEKIACPQCETPVVFDIVFSVNAVARPDLRNGILDRSFQRRTCDECGHTFRVEPELTYLDAKRKQWILTRPYSDIATWGEMERYATSFYAAAFGPKAPPASQRIGQGMSARVVFGWSAIREKIYCNDVGIDDVVLELTKFALMRTESNLAYSDENELRLIAIDGPDLVFAWIHGETEEVQSGLKLPKDVYDEIHADAEGWRSLKEDLTAGPFVDMRRLLVPSEA